MAVGNTITGSLSDSLDVVVASARSTREHKGVVTQLIDRVSLSPGTGLDWKETLFAQLSAQAITEQTVMDNPQAYSDSSISIRPQMVQMQTFISDKVRRNLNRKSLGQMGALAGNAMVRKEDEDGLTSMAASTINLGAAGTPVLTGYVASARYLITSNPTEPGDMPISGVFHGYSMKDFYDELVAGLGTYPIESGATADVLKGGFHLPICSVTIHEDGNIPIDSLDDVKNFVFAKKAWILVSGMSMRRETRREPHIGGGGDSLFITHEYAYGERSPGNWSASITGDATAPA